MDLEWLFSPDANILLFFIAQLVAGAAYGPNIDSNDFF